MKEQDNYTIKDIARMAGVSAGTVDRVLHDRGDVSERSRAKVQRVLDEIHYQPNVFAIGLAAKKRYSIACMIPSCRQHDYWHLVWGGMERAKREIGPFNVAVDYVCYRHGDESSYRAACGTIAESGADAVLIVPNFRSETLELAARLHELDTPYAFVDFNMEDTRALTYIGQDSYRSGYIAAKILMRNYAGGEELALFLSNDKHNPAEIQMQRRLQGFMDYIDHAQAGLLVHEVILDKNDPEQNRPVLDDFFRAHPSAVLGVVFNSRIYQLGAYLRQARRKMKGLVGYDLLEANVDLLKSGDVHCLLGQRPELQGYYGVKALCDHVVFKKTVAPVKYMPIDLLIKENIDFYFEFA